MLTLVVLLSFVGAISAQCHPDRVLTVAVPRGGNASVLSPDYPNDYPKNANCQWLINGANTDNPGLELSAADFDVEGGNCKLDYLLIIQINADGSETQLGRFCGDIGPRKLISFTNKVRLIFISDNFLSKRGFKISVKEPICATGSKYCPGSDQVCFSPTQLCNGLVDCPDGSDEGPHCSVACGSTTIPAKQDGSRIVGGEEANPHSLPWQVALLSSTGSFACGGSIINSEWVLTAAHCCRIYLSVPRNYKVRAGMHVLGSTNETYAMTYDVSHLIIHPGYQRPSVSSNDICLLKISTMFEFGTHVAPVCLADNADCASGSAALVSGWGSKGSALQIKEATGFPVDMGEDKSVSDTETPRATALQLQQAYVDITTTETCKKAYGVSLGADMVCAARTGKDACQGDSGGPLAQKNVQGLWKLCGVVSWGRGCAQARYPGVYAGVNAAIDWIRETILFN